jgi:hypothetical protein
MLAGGGPPLGYTLSGAMAAALGPSAALVLGAVACAALVGVVGVARKELREPDLGSITAQPVALDRKIDEQALPDSPGARV